MNDLRKLAEEATPGPWWAPIGRMGVDALAAERPDLLIGAICAPSRNDVVFVEHYEDMEFVAAANPTVILRLLDVVEAAQNLHDHIVEGLESQTHLPGDLCVRQLKSALRAAHSSAKVETDG